MAEKCWNFEY